MRQTRRPNTKRKGTLMSRIIDRLHAIEESAKLNKQGKLSERYAHVSTLSLVDALSGVIDVDGGKLKHINGSSHHISFPIKALRDTLIGGDRVAPTLHVFNSFGGERALTIRLGAYRFVCANGLVIGASVFEAKARHIEGPKLNDTLQRLHDTVAKVDLSAVFSNVEALSQKHIDRTTLERMLDDLRLPFKLYHRALHRYEKPIRHTDVGLDAWRVYNRVQEVIAEGRGKAGDDDNRRLMDYFLVA